MEIQVSDVRFDPAILGLLVNVRVYGDMDDLDDDEKENGDASE